MERHSFHAMGTRVEAVLDMAPGPDAVLALATVEAEFERLERLLSRFRPDSELARLNAEGELEAGDDLLAVVELALAARERTRGRFDPTIHDALVAAGYDRSFELVNGDRPETRVPAGDGPDQAGQNGRSRPVAALRVGAGRVDPAPRLGHQPAPRELPGGHRSRDAGPDTSPFGPARGGGRVGVSGRRLSLAPGVRLDLGGIGKGYAVDRAVSQLAPLAPCLVNAGGDLAVAGVPASGVWPVGIETPAGPLTLGLATGALATSGQDRRRWRAGGEERHHLIDPATGRPADSDLLTVTVAGASAVEAEVLAKALFLAGEEAAAAEADALRIPALLVAADGRVRFAGGLA